MAWKQVQNVTILANIGDVIPLPQTVVALDENNNWKTVNIGLWRDANQNEVTEARTDIAGEFMYFGRIAGYVHMVYCSVVVGDSDENPASVFPTDFESMTSEDISDNFGIPKQEIRTSDMTNIDDYQYFKSKKNRTTLESAQLQKLTELLASKIIMAKDINFVRNGIKNAQEFLLSLSEWIDENAVVDGENVGSGSGKVFAGTEDADGKGQKMKFRKLKAGDNINIDTDGDSIEISAEVPEAEEISSDFCSMDHIKAKGFETCSLYYEGDGDDIQKGAFLKFSDYLGIKVMPAKDKSANSMMFVFGLGNGVNDMINAGRIFKGKRDFIFEMKVGENKYSGVHIKGHYDGQPEHSGLVDKYENQDYSRIQAAVENDNATIRPNGDKDVYSNEVAIGQ